MIYSTEKISDKSFEINHSDIINISFRDTLTLRKNGRVDWYIMYLLEGCCTVVEKGVRTRAVAGDLILYRPGERQEYSFSQEDETVYAYAHFSGTECEELFASLAVFRSRITHVGTFPQLERLFREAVRERYLKKPFWEQTSAALLLQFLIAAARCITADSRHIGSQLEQVIQHMHQHYAQPLSVSFYADMCHLSESRFAHLFKQITGLPPKQYLMGIKAEKACDLLAFSSLSISEVAHMVGIEDINYFGRWIKKLTGKTPKAFRAHGQPSAAAGCTDCEKT